MSDPRQIIEKAFADAEANAYRPPALRVESHCSSPTAVLATELDGPITAWLTYDGPRTEMIQ